MTGQVIGRAGFSTARVTRIRSWASSSVSRGSGKVCHGSMQGIIKIRKEELGFERVQMLVMPENEISLHLAERLGFTQLDQVTWEGTCYERLLMEL